MIQAGSSSRGGASRTFGRISHILGRDPPSRPKRAASRSFPRLSRWEARYRSSFRLCSSSILTVATLPPVYRCSFLLIPPANAKASRGKAWRDLPFRC